MITQLFISPQGSDEWNGLQPTVNAEGTDGPLATFEGSRKRVARLREQNMTVGVVVVRVLSGHYSFSRPLAFEAGDRDIRFVATDGEVIVDGCAVVEEWCERGVNGRPCWIADIPHLLNGRATPRSLFVKGQRRPRSRYPKQGFLQIEDVPDHRGQIDLFSASASRFVVKEGDFDVTWRNHKDIEAVVNHLWIEERMPVVCYEPDSRRVTSSHHSVFSLKNSPWMGKACAEYYWDNVMEAMSEPGEWYIDAVEERLYYLPQPDEDIRDTRVNLPLVRQLVRFHGEIDGETKVEGIHFEGITFQHTDWIPSDGWGKWWDPETPEHMWRTRDSYRHFLTLPSNAARMAAVPQSAYDLPGAISFEAAVNCSLLNCSFRQLGFYAIDVRGGCSHLRFQGNELNDIGGGGIKIDGAGAKGDQRFRTHHIYAGDNRISRCGRVFASAAGIIIVHADQNVIEHNEISDQYYTAISVGWVWGYDENSSSRNLIQSNYIHDIGLGRLSDMGGIYTLGVQPGTVIRGNHIHDVKGNHYGGWGIYLDEGSAFITVEQNLVYRTNSQSFNEHWGRGNVIRDNVFFSAASECVQLCAEDHDNYIQYPAKGCLFLRNALLTEGHAIFKDRMTYFDSGILDSDANVFWNYEAGSKPLYCDYSPFPDLRRLPRAITIDDARAIGLERHSLWCDPKFLDPRNGNFELTADSPLRQLGIKLLDKAKCGPREPVQRLYIVGDSYRPRSGFAGFSD